MKKKNKKDSQIRSFLMLSRYTERRLKKTFLGRVYNLLEVLEKKIKKIRNMKALREETEIIQYIEDLNNGFITSSQCQWLIEEMLRTGESQIESERKVIDFNLEEN